MTTEADATTTAAPTAAPARRRFAMAWSVLRIAMAVAIIAATIETYRGSAVFWAEQGFADLVTLNVNFFAYFTIESNLAAAAVLMIGAVFAFAGRPSDPKWFAVLRGSVVTYMAITGIVYNLLLRGLPVTGGGDSSPWTNEVMHVIAPIFLVLDWLLAPGRIELAWRWVWVIISFPIVWVTFTLVRGPLVFDQVRQVETWYPYPFLNPARQDDWYLGVMFWVLVIAAAFTVVAILVVWVSHLGAPRSEPREPAVRSSREQEPQT
ncbi:Pr6Pr family membrane protein [Agromyces sp. SYSU K20354]|uniref:Pr6Pr family membrane protein n=1 Tax=Agromyces cavernae TaxID=2898659 RepID=UPI001E533ED0|nr:Pr6Pr family membrane protein [Agromyces cavernae]MCD2441989.1 Pr6Pr family membrane protein [Agromyces cavernae]